MDTCEIVQCQRLFKGKCSINTKYAIKDCPPAAEYVNTLKDKAELFDEAVDLRSELYAALGVLILATPTGNYRNDLTELNIRFMEHIRKAKEL